MYNFFFKSRSAYALCIFAFTITCLFLYLLLLPIDFNLNGYINDTTPDVAQHLSGWYAFVHEPWHFPLLKTYLLNYPDGTTISLTDSIPLFAVLFKLFRGILPEGFNYFGIFILFNYFFQAVSALVLAVSLNRKNYIATLGFVMFALSAPPVSLFVGYEESLTCQGLLLMAISGYFFSFNNKLNLRSGHLFFGTLLILSLLIHPYLTAMIYPFYLLSLWQIKKQNDPSWQRFIMAVISLHLLILLEFFVFGLASGTNAASQFGAQSVNLIQPFSGGLFTFNPITRVYPDIAENVAYLGLGLMFAIVLALFMQAKNLTVNYKKHKGLSVVFGLFVFISVYGDVWFGSHHLFTLKAPSFFLTNDFRTNERFIWPAWYLAMAFAIATLSKDWRQKATLWFIPILIAIQLMDVSNYIIRLKHNLDHDYTPKFFVAPYYTMMHSLMSSTKPTPDYEQVRSLIRQSKIVIFYPTPKQPSSQNLITSYKMVYFVLGEIQLLTAMEGVPINNAYIAHYSKKLSTDEADDFTNLNPKLLVSPADMLSPTIKRLLVNHPDDCHEWNAIYYCRYASPSSAE